MPQPDPTLPGDGRAPASVPGSHGGPLSIGDSTIGGANPDSTWGADRVPPPPPVADAVPPIGARFDRFEVVRQLGAGAMGVVMLARDVDLARPVAIKFLSRRVVGDEAGNLRLLREAQAVARLQHPNVVAVHEVGKLGEQIFVVMEYVDGGTLRQWCAAATRTWQEIVEVYVQAALGLDAAHAAGLVHRDFKPDNALIGSDGRVRVSDFGLVSGSTGEPAVSGGAPEDVSLTRTGAVLGTPAYMAPEQFAGSDVGPAADQFALCVALFEALYGQRPFAGAHFMEILGAIESGTLAAQTRADVPRSIHGAIIRGVARDPALRHPSMRALADALRWRPQIAPPRRPKGPVVAVAAVAVCMLALVGTGAWWLSRDPPSVPPPDPPSVPVVVPQVEASWACRTRPAIDTTWNAGAAKSLTEAFVATGSPFATETAARIVTALDGYGLALRNAMDATCRSPPVDAAVAQRAEACLANAFDALAGTVAALSQGPTLTVVEAGMIIATGMASPVRCVDAHAIAADGKPPSRRPEELAAIRRTVWGAFALMQAGEVDSATLAIEATRESIAALDVDALDVSSALLRGHIAERRGDAVGADGALREALAHARAASDVTMESVLLADLLRLNVSGLGRIADAEAIAKQLRALLPRVSSDYRFYGHGALSQLAIAAGRIPEADAEASAEIDGLAALSWPKTVALGLARMRRANLRIQIGRPAEAIVDAEQALVELGQSVGARSVAYASALTEVAVIHLVRGDRAAARGRLGEARGVLDQASPAAQLMLAEVLLRFADLERMAGENDQAARLLTDAFGIAERSGDEERVARVAIDLALVEFLRGNYEETAHGLEIAVGVAERFPHSRHIDRVRLTYLRAGLAYAMGEIAEAIKLHGQRLTLVESGMGPMSGLASSAHIDIGELHVLDGDCAEADVAFGRAQRIREGLGFVPDLDLARMLAARAVCHARAEDVVGARDELRQVAALPETVAPAVYMIPRLAMIEAEIALVEGDQRRARTEAEKAKTAYAAMGTPWKSQVRDVEAWMDANLDEVTPPAGGAGGRMP